MHARSRRALTMRSGVAGVALCLALLAASVLSPLRAEEPALQGDAVAYAAEGDRLFVFLAATKTEAEGRAMEDEIWRFWMRAPDQEAAALMDRAMERRRTYDFAGAVEILDRLVAIAPGWAEAWNQRATVRFLQEDYEGSLADIRETLDREPRHFGAMAGMAIILLRQGRAELAQATLHRAVAIHPWLRERSLIVVVPGKDI
ncbi:MAG: hypothetical protein KDK07_16095 [Bauldia sp.]|nr:hypothetical protein [Bauldia sp.]